MTTPKARDAVFQPEFREDLRYWVKTDRRTALRIFTLIEAIRRDPFGGIGKPEPLKHLGAGVWSRQSSSQLKPPYAPTIYAECSKQPALAKPLLEWGHLDGGLSTARAYFVPYPPAASPRPFLVD